MMSIWSKWVHLGGRGGENQSNSNHSQGKIIRTVILCIFCGVLLVDEPINSQSNSQSKFGQQWGKLELPINALIGVIDKSEKLEIGLSAMQLANIGFSGEYNALTLRFLNKAIKAYVYNAFGMKALGGARYGFHQPLPRS